MNPTEEKGDDSEHADDGMSPADDLCQIFLLNIDIMGAYDLVKADTFGKSDPYCKVSAISTSFTTCTIKKTLNPTWNEHVEMTFFNDPKCIRFEVFDWDGKLGGKDDPIGNCQFDIAPNFYSDINEFQGKIKLENVKSGEIEVKIVARKLLPLELEKRLTELHDREDQNTNTIATQETKIQDMNDQNNTLQNEINGLQSDINGLNVEIPTKQSERKTEEETGVQLDSEQKQLSDECDALEGQYSEIETKESEATKEWEDLRVREDKQNTECERLREDIGAVTKQIEDKEKEAQERRAKEAEDKEQSERESLKSDNEKKENEAKEEVNVGAAQASIAKGDDDMKPLVGKGTKGGDTSSGCDCCIIM